MPPGMRGRPCILKMTIPDYHSAGNYITLTNMTEKDVECVLFICSLRHDQYIGTEVPTELVVRCFNRFAGDKLKYLDQLYEGHVEMNGQIVCCKGVNDGEELRRSIEDLPKYICHLCWLVSCSAGITKYRDGVISVGVICKRRAGALLT